MSSRTVSGPPASSSIVPAGTATFAIATSSSGRRTIAFSARANLLTPRVCPRSVDLKPRSRRRTMRAHVEPSPGPDQPWRHRPPARPGAHHQRDHRRLGRADRHPEARRGAGLHAALVHRHRLPAQGLRAARTGAHRAGQGGDDPRGDGQHAGAAARRLLARLALARHVPGARLPGRGNGRRAGRRLHSGRRATAASRAGRGGGRRDGRPARHRALPLHRDRLDGARGALHGLGGGGGGGAAAHAVCRHLRAVGGRLPFPPPRVVQHRVRGLRCDRGRRLGADLLPVLVSGEGLRPQSRSERRLARMEVPRPGLAAGDERRRLAVLRSLHDRDPRLLRARRGDPPCAGAGGRGPADDRDALAHVPGDLRRLEPLAVPGGRLCGALFDGLRRDRLERPAVRRRAGRLQGDELREPGGAGAGGPARLRAAAGGLDHRLPRPRLARLARLRGGARPGVDAALPGAAPRSTSASTRPRRPCGRLASRRRPSFSQPSPWRRPGSTRCSTSCAPSRAEGVTLLPCGSRPGT